MEFMSGLILNIHAAAQQLDYANQHSGNKRPYVSAMGSNDQRAGRGRAHQGGGHIGQRSGRSSGWGRDSRGPRRGNECKTNANNVDISDPHRKFTPDEWERLGFTRSYVLHLPAGGRGGRGRSDQSYQGTNTNRTTKLYLQQIRILMISLTQPMCWPTSWLCPKSQSEDPRTVAVSAVAPIIPDS